ncbi:hypothetical protein, partial [Streptomyces sp. NPDC004250]|uniref:hypothetical protein n=1 Tax=Streptomyces sp. NPDC004250 TaxID=3364692 RepID=UPI0036BA859B
MTAQFRQVDPVMRDDVGDEGFVAGLVFADDDGVVADVGVLLEGGLGFGGFDAEAAYFGLFVGAAEVVDGAVG